MAFHRDISDPQLIENLATAVRTVDSLRQLFLLTFADIRASGKELWNTWKAELLIDLYNKTYDLLKGRGCTVKQVEGVIEKVKYLMGNIVGFIVGIFNLFCQLFPPCVVF